MNHEWKIEIVVDTFWGSNMSAALQKTLENLEMDGWQIHTIIKQPDSYEIICFRDKH